MTVTDNTDVPAVVVEQPKRRMSLVSTVSLPVELGIAGLGGIVAGLGSFTGSLTATSASDWTSLKAGLIGGGFTAVVFFTNSLKNWYSQQYGG